MSPASLRLNESAALEALRKLDVLDTGPEAEFDALVKVAATVCGVPISLISLVDAQRQWFKANIGLPGVTQTDRDVAFCAHAVLGDDVLEVPDATQDVRFADNPLVAGGPHIRFYAGAPLRVGDGVCVGTLCVIDRQPRRLDARQRRTLTELSQAAGRVLEGRRATHEARETARILAVRERYLHLVVDSSPSMMAYWNADLCCLYANRTYEDWLGVPPEALIGMPLHELLGPAQWPGHQPRVEAALQGRQQAFENTFALADGAPRHCLTFYVPDMLDGRVVGILAQITDITPLKRTEAALRAEVAERAKVNALLSARTQALREAQRLGRIGSWEWQVAPERVVGSDELYRILGLDPTATLSFADAERLHTPADWLRMKAAVERALSQGEPYAMEVACLHPDGSQHWVEARGEALRDEAGRIVGLRGTAQDIDERRELIARLAHQHQLLQVTLQSIADAVITTDMAGHVTWLNPAAERLSGWSAALATGRALADVFHAVDERTRQAIPDPVAVSLTAGPRLDADDRTVLIARDGRRLGIQQTVAPIRGAAGEPLGVVLVFRDVSEQRRMAAEMTHRATHDALTGLLNRDEFGMRLQAALAHARASHGEHALLYIDLDQFKLINDTCGHTVGDDVLRQVSRLLVQSVRTDDTLARLGGDEFAILLSHCTVSHAQRVAQDICQRMDDFRFVCDGRRFRIGTSIGLVPVNEHWVDVSAIQQAADSACYAAKDAGRNRVHVWLDSDQALRARLGEMRWAARIEQALDEDRFVLYAQRIAPLRHPQEGVHAEILLRMQGDDGTLAPPGAFLPAAERFCLAARVDRWVLAHVRVWMQGLPNLDAVGCLSVNLSGQSVGDPAFHAWASELLAQAGPRICSKLCLEITETAAVTNMADAARFVDQVRAAGVRVALDDFGSGASSFGYLKKLTVDCLKIDGQFIRNLVDDPLDEAAVRCFTDVARLLGVQTVAEFVDRQDVLDRLAAIGVDHVQGFLIHRPAPLDTLISPGAGSRAPAMPPQQGGHAIVQGGHAIVQGAAP